MEFAFFGISALTFIAPLLQMKLALAPRTRVRNGTCSTPGNRLGDRIAAIDSRYLTVIVDVNVPSLALLAN